MSEIRAAEELILGGDVCRIQLTVTPAGPDGGEADAMAKLWGDEATTRQLIKDICGIATSALKDAYWGGEYSSFRTVDYWSTLSIDLTGAKPPTLTFAVRGYTRAVSTRGWPAGTAFEESVLRLLRRLKEGVENQLRLTGLEVTAFADWNPGPGISIERAAEYAVERRARDEAAELTAEAGFLHKRARQIQNTVLPAVAAVFLLVAVILIVILGSYTATIIVAAIAGGALLVLVTAGRGFVAIQEDRARSLEAEADLRELLKGKEDERRAQKQFQLHTHELERYYNQALTQRGRIFVVGIVCILAGFGVIALAFILLSDDGVTKNLSEKIVVAALGAVAGILANFVAVIFLRMFSATVESMTAFHVRLVGTHHLHFGNVLAARVTNPDLRDEVLADMARALAAVPHDGVFSEPVPANVPVEQNGASSAGLRVPPATTRGQV